MGHQPHVHIELQHAVEERIDVDAGDKHQRQRQRQRNGSSNHATSSPLSLPLITNPIHQTTSLDNYFGIPMDRQRQRDPIGGALGMPARRFSEYTLETGPSLSFAPHPLGQKYASDTENCNAGSNDARVSGMLGKSSDRLALAPPVSAIALAIAGDDVDDAGGGDSSSINSAFQPIKAQSTKVFGSWRDSFDHQLSSCTRRTACQPTAGPRYSLDNSVLMHTMSFASGAPKSATQSPTRIMRQRMAVGQRKQPVFGQWSFVGVPGKRNSQI
ncbi:hypothetical protein BX661DRAFT_40124 [Kickxella alabastrina]|uniref:uncharacterized protein n=1 Tax=Kickxella alabastrina TaxID=61397 RepID=UPI00221F4BEE|nr:uncharacterized protein BX661DRAFT_40124 [Kickxella alabastrina]KAI7825588.1 hypothetical protein BX661DRAFT_40124 [Kickxella alabastrina]